MDRISYLAIMSISYIFYNGISTLEINKNYEYMESPFKTRNDFEELVLKEVYDLLNSISLILYDIESGDIEVEKEIENIKRIMTQELLCMKELESDDFRTKINTFVEENLRENMIPFFNEVINEALRIKNIGFSFGNQDSLTKLKKLFEEIRRIYEESEGNPADSTTVLCPQCETHTSNFTCAWDTNKHMHYYCEHCGLNFMQ